MEVVVKAYCDDCVAVVEVGRRERVSGDRPTCARCDSEKLSVPIAVHEELVGVLEWAVEEVRSQAAGAGGAVREPWVTETLLLAVAVKMEHQMEVTVGVTNGSNK